jgi:hypothetical protein
MKKTTTNAQGEILTIDNIKIEYYKTVIGLLLSSGNISEKDLLPIIKRGMSKWVRIPQKKLFKKSN